MPQSPSAATLRLTLCCLAAIVACGSAGCVSTDALWAHIAYNDATNDFVMGWRNSAWANQAWHARKGQFAGEPQFHAFGQGFRDGYISVASGGNGCPPPLPPRNYWNWRYQTAEGQAQVAAWFAGFPHGAQAADEEGAGLYQQIQVSHPIQMQYSPEFLNATIMQQMIYDTVPGVGPPPGPAFEQIYPPPPQPVWPELPPPQPGNGWNGPRPAGPPPGQGALWQQPAPPQSVWPATLRLPVDSDPPLNLAEEVSLTSGSSPSAPGP